MIDLINEIIIYIKSRKKYFLIPIFLVLGTFGALIVLSQGSVIAPFVYTLSNVIYSWYILFLS